MEQKPQGYKGPERRSPQPSEDYKGPRRRSLDWPFSPLKPAEPEAGNSDKAPPGPPDRV